MDMLPYVFIGFIVYIIVRYVYIKKKNIKIDRNREFFLCIFNVYIIALLSQTIIPSFTFGRDSLTGEIFFVFNMENSQCKCEFYTI